METADKLPKKGRGGKRPGTGRKFGANKANGYKAPPGYVPPKKEEPQKMDEPPKEEPPKTPPNEQKPPVGDDQQSAGSQHSQDDDDDGDDPIDFGKYKRRAEASAQPLENPIPGTPPPPPVVVIDGKVLMGMINFLAPPIFKYICNFALGGGYVTEDFALEEEQMKFLYPAADSVARRLFANMPDYVQLIFGYGVISFSNARKKKRIRSKGTGTPEDPKIIYMHAETVKNE